MESGLGRSDSGRYRWRGDGRTCEPECFDYLHGMSGVGSGLRDGGDEVTGTVESRRHTVDDRLIHLDLVEDEDDTSRTA